MIGGTMHINEYNFAEWQATNEGNDFHPDTGEDCARYECRVEYRNHRGYNHKYTFDVYHVPGDGALALTILILEETNRRVNG